MGKNDVEKRDIMRTISPKTAFEMTEKCKDDEQKSEMEIIDSN